MNSFEGGWGVLGGLKVSGVMEKGVVGVNGSSSLGFERDLRVLAVLGDPVVTFNSRWRHNGAGIA